MHERINSFGFFPINYDPFTRKVTLSTFNDVGNSIFVKNIDDAINRCSESKSFCIHTANDLVI